VTATGSPPPPVQPQLRALAETFVPEIAGSDPNEWREVLGIIDQALGRQTHAVRRQLLLFAGVLDWLPVLRHGRRFRSLDPERRLRFLQALQDSRLVLLRRGVWGLRTLTFMGYYARPAAYSEIDYGAHPDGWERP
jgi:hypothetical protein